MGPAAAPALPPALAGRAPRASRRVVDPDEGKDGILEPSGDPALERQAQSALCQAREARRRDGAARLPPRQPAGRKSLRKRRSKEPPPLAGRAAQDPARQGMPLPEVRRSEER